MSLGIFRSIRGSYVESYRREADRIIRALNLELRRRGLPEYRDPDPNERALRRLPCGNAGASTFIALNQLAHSAGSPWSLSGGAIALPFEFEGILKVPYGRFLFVIPETQTFCPLSSVRDEVAALAPHLGIPLVDGAIRPEIADRLAENQGLPGDPAEGYLESERSLWLDLHLACRYGLEDGTPLLIR